MKNIIIFICLILQSSSSIQQQKKKPISFEDTIEAFPQIKENINPKKIVQILQQLPKKIQQMLEIVKIVVIDNQKYIFTENLNDRTQTIQYAFNTVFQNKNLPDMYVILFGGDQIDYMDPQFDDYRQILKELPGLAMSKNIDSLVEQNKILIPDPSMLTSWDYLKQRIEGASLNNQWENKIEKAFWRGNPSGYGKTIDEHKRTKLVMLSQKHESLIDAKFIESPYFYQQKLVEPIKSLIQMYGDKNIHTSQIQEEFHLPYKYLASLDGNTCAWQRVPWILQSNSVLLKQETNYVQWFYDKLVPYKHYVPMKEDLSDLVEKIEELKKDDVKAREISEAGTQFVKENLQTEIIHSYYLDVLNKYANLQKFSLSESDKQQFLQNVNIDDLILQSEKMNIKQIENQNKIKYISFEDTIEAFPLIKENINPKKIVQILQQLPKKIQQMLEIVKIVVIDNKKYIFTENINDRTQTIQNAFNTVFQNKNLPDMYVILFGGDQIDYMDPQFDDYRQILKELPGLAMSKNIDSLVEQNKILIPDPSMLTSWDYLKQRIEGASLNNQWENKIEKAFWRGNPSGYGKTIDEHKRTKLVMLSQKHESLLDAKFIESPYFYQQKLVEPIKSLIQMYGDKNIHTSQIQEEFHLPYKYLASLDGNTCAWQRVPWILQSNSVLLKQETNHVQWFYDKLVPYKHYVPMKEDLSDLVEKIEELKKDDVKAREISEAGTQFVKENLQTEIIHSYYLDVLNKYAYLQNFSLTEIDKQLFDNHFDIDDIILMSDKQKFDQLKTVINNSLIRQNNSYYLIGWLLGVIFTLGAIYMIQKFYNKNLYMNIRDQSSIQLQNVDELHQII